MEPVGELNDEEELEEEGHAGVRVAFPQRGNAQKIFPGITYHSKTSIVLSANT